MLWKKKKIEIDWRQCNAKICFNFGLFIVLDWIYNELGRSSPGLHGQRMVPLPHSPTPTIIFIF